MGPPYKYSGFISYRHSERQKVIARLLERGLSRYARPFWKVRGVRLFRDETNLAASPDLFGRIIEALDNSHSLLLMASPEAATSRWVEKELTHWLDRRGQSGLIFALTDGELAWNEEAGSFDVKKTTALPAALLSRFTSEPLYVDLRWSKSPEVDLIEDDPRFADVLATVLAAMRGVDKDEIAGEHLKTRRVFRLSVSAIMAILIGLAGGLAYAMLEARKETAIAQAQEERAEKATAQALKERNRAEDAATQAVAERNRAEDEKYRARQELVRAQRNESLALAEQSLRETAGGDAISGVRIALSALPPDLSIPDRPVVPRAELALSRALNANRLEFSIVPSQDWVNDAAFSPDGTQIAVATRDGYLKMLDAKTGKELRSFNDHKLAVLALAYSADGKYLAIAHQDPPSIQVRDSATGVVLWSEKVNARLRSLTFTPDSTKLISLATGNTRPQVWNASTGELKLVLDSVASGARSTSFDADSRLYALATYTQGMFVWDLESGKIVASTGRTDLTDTAIRLSSGDEDESVFSAAFLPKGRGLILVGKRTLYILDPYTREIKKQWKFADEWIVGPNILRISSDAEWALISTSATELVAVSLTDGHTISRFKYQSAISEVVLSPDNRLITAVAEDHILTAWNLDGSRSFSFPTGHAERVKPPYFSMDSSKLVSYGDKSIRVWDARDTITRLSPLPPSWKVQAISPDDKHAFVSKEPTDTIPRKDGPVERYQLWSIERGTRISDFALGTEENIESVHFSEDGRWLALYQSRASEGTSEATHVSETSTPPEQAPSETTEYVHSFTIVDTHSEVSSKRLRITNAWSNFDQIVLSNDGSTLGLTWSEYGKDGTESESTAEVWQASTAIRLHHMPQAGYEPRLTFTADNRFMVLRTNTKLKYNHARISIWALPVGTKISEFDRDLESSENVRVLDNGPTMIVGSATTPPQVVSLSSGANVGDFAGKAIGVMRVNRSDDHVRLLVERQDAPSTLWNLQTNEFVSYLPTNQAERSSVAFSDDGRRVLTTREENSKFVVEIFDAGTGKLLKELAVIPQLRATNAGRTGSHVLIQTDLDAFDIHDVDPNTPPKHVVLKDRLFRWRTTANDRNLVTADESGRIQFWELNTGKQITETFGADRAIPLGFAPTSLDRIPIILADGNVAVFNTGTGETIWRSPNGTKAISAELTMDGNAIVIREPLRLAAFDIGSGFSIGSAEIPEGQDAYYNLSNASDRIFFDVRGGTSKLFDVAGRKEIQTYTDVQLSQLAPNGKILIIGNGNKLKVFDATTGVARVELEFTQSVSKIQLDSSGEKLAVATQEPRLIMVSLQDGTQQVIGSPRHVPTWIQFGATSGELIVYEDSGNLTLRNAESGRILTEFPSEWSKKTSLSEWIYKLDPTKTLLGVRAPDNYINVLRVGNGSQVTHFNWDDQAIADLEFSGDGRRLLIVAETGYLLVWNLSTNRGERVVQLDRKYDRYHKVLKTVVDPAYVVATDRDGRIDLVSLNTFESRLFYSGSPERDIGVALSTDGALLATMGRSGVLRIWHVGSRDILLETQLINDSIYQPPEIKFSPDSRVLTVSANRIPPQIVLVPLIGNAMIAAAKVAIAQSGLAGQETKTTAQKPRLGISLQDVTSEIAAASKLPPNQGAIVVEVLPDSAAVAAGLQRGDIILQVNDKVITKSADVTLSVKEAKQELTLQLMRDKKPMKVQVVLTD